MPQKEFVVKVILGKKIDFLQLKKAEAIIVDKFKKHGISVFENDIKIKHRCEAYIEKLISTEVEGDDDCDFSYDYDNYLTNPYHAHKVSHLEDDIDYTETEKFISIKAVPKVVNLFFLYAVVKNVNYDQQVADLAALKAQKEKEEIEYNSPENIQKEKLKEKLKKHNKTLEAITNIEANPKALESVIQKPRTKLESYHACKVEF